ncbi:unnamed protein product [Urochloa humidicola]
MERRGGAPARAGQSQSGGGARGLPLPRLLHTVRQSIWPAAARRGTTRRPAARGLCSPLCSSATSHTPLPLLSAVEISRPAGARPAASAADLTLAGWSSRGRGGPLHRRRLLPSAASIAGLYPHHPLLRRWRCGKGREQRRRSTSGVDLVVAEQRTSGGADLSGGGHLRRPPPQPPAARPAKSGGDSASAAVDGRLLPSHLRQFPPDARRAAVRSGISGSGRWAAAWPPMMGIDLAPRISSSSPSPSPAAAHLRPPPSPRSEMTCRRLALPASPPWRLRGAEELVALTVYVALHLPCFLSGERLLRCGFVRTGCRLPRPALALSRASHAGRLALWARRRWTQWTSYGGSSGGKGPKGCHPNAHLLQTAAEPGSCPGREDTTVAKAA